jgi:Shikimate kinase
MKIIFLMGFTASGKTTIGRLLAKSLSANFIDIDEMIAKKKEMSVRSFYGKYGKKAFQEIEAEILRNCLESEALKGNTLVISSGGGLIENVDACAILKKHSNVKIFFLHNKPKILFNRLLKKTKKQHSFPAFLKTSPSKDLHTQIKLARFKFLIICKKRTELLKQINYVKVKTKGLNVKKLLRLIKKLSF